MVKNQNSILVHFLNSKLTHCGKDQQRNGLMGNYYVLKVNEDRGRRRVCVSVNGHLVKCPFIDPLTNTHISSKRGSQLKYVP